MPKLSTYTADYTNPEVLPWDFWTEEEKSLVIKEAYKRLYLTSNEVEPYISVSRKHCITQFLGPISLAVLYKYNLKTTLFGHFYRMSPLQGNMAGAVFLGLSTILWLNFNPYYIQKEQMQDKTLNLLYTKLGSGMKILNDFLPRSTTSGMLDRQLEGIYNQRNGPLAGTLEPEEDTMPPILPRNASVKNWKKIYQ